MSAEARTIASETEAAINAADHLTDRDRGAVEVLRRLAEQADYLVAHGGMSEAGKFDNVTIPTYLRYAEALQLTPTARADKTGKPQGVASGNGDNTPLGKLRAIGAKAG